METGLLGTRIGGAAALCGLVRAGRPPRSLFLGLYEERRGRAHIGSVDVLTAAVVCLLQARPPGEPGDVCCRVGTGWRPCLASGEVGRQPLESRQPGLTLASSTFPLCDLGQLHCPSKSPSHKL